jgi:diadenosine tetraphosphate (Ap4A) HIT family hydrolase
MRWSYHGDREGERAVVATQVRTFFSKIREDVERLSLKLKGQRGNCLFCLASGKISRDKVVAETPWAYLIVEYSQTVPGTYMIVPKRHKESIFRLGIFFWLSVHCLLRKIPWMGIVDWNLSMNFGRDAGQTVPHIHMWVIPREGKFAGKGMAYHVAQAATNGN